MSAPGLDWRDLVVGPAASIRETVRVIDRNRVGFALVCESDGRLVGTVSDGDVRRSLLRDIPLSEPVSRIMEARFTAVEHDASLDKARAVMESRRLRFAPAVDRTGKLTGVHLLDDLRGAPVLPNWAVVMAGGEGLRLRPLTDAVPKPMLPVAGQPILETIVRRLVAAGLRRVFLAVNYLGEKIEGHFGDGSAFGCSIEYLREDRPLGTAGALGLLPSAPPEAVLVANGDLVTDIDFAALIHHHAAAGAAATMCVRQFENAVPFGVVSCDGGRVVSIDEKPVQRLLINAGIYVVEPSLLARVPARAEVAITDLLRQALDSGESVSAFAVHESWADIGRPADYERARAGRPSS